MGAVFYASQRHDCEPLDPMSSPQNGKQESGRSSRLQWKFPGDVDFIGFWLFRHACARLLPSGNPFLSSCVADDVWGGILIGPSAPSCSERIPITMPPAGLILTLNFMSWYLFDWCTPGYARSLWLRCLC